MKTKITFIALSFLLVGMVKAQDKGLVIAKEADKRDLGWVNSSVKLKMTLTNKNGQSTVRDMDSKSLEVENDGDKTLVQFNTPVDVKGTAFLSFSHKTGNDDQWLYLPALKRVKRIASNNKSGPFMGSEFAFEDISSEEVEKYTYKYIAEEKANNMDCFKIERYPVSKNSGYTKQIVWYNKSNYRLEKIEYYDRKNAHLKTLTYTSYKLYNDKFWRAEILTMINHINKKQTVLKFIDQKFIDSEVKEDDFSENTLMN